MASNKNEHGWWNFLEDLFHLTFDRNTKDRTKRKGDGSTDPGQENTMEKMAADLLPIFNKANRENGESGPDVEEDKKMVSESENFVRRSKEPKQKLNLAASGNFFQERKSVQKSPVPPAHFRTSKGDFFCNVCQWTQGAADSDNPLEGFLNHCKTNSHMMKLRKRFKMEKYIENKSAEPKKNVTQNKDRANTGLEDRWMNITETKNETEKESKNKREKEMCLKEMALAKGLACIQPISDTELKCVLCNKNIPKASDLGVLMKNLSSHIQSKGHLAMLKMEKTAETLNEEKTLKTGKKTTENVSKVKTFETGKKNRYKDPWVQNSPALNRNVNQKADSLFQGNKPDEFNNTKQSEPKQFLPSFPKKQDPKISAEKLNSNASRAKFLCLTCNIMGTHWEPFRAHLECKKHLKALEKNGIQPDVILCNMIDCETCGVFLVGSLYALNEHHNDCSRGNESELNFVEPNPKLL